MRPVEPALNREAIDAGPVPIFGWNQVVLLKACMLPDSSETRINSDHIRIKPQANQIGRLCCAGDPRDPACAVQAAQWLNGDRRLFKKGILAGFNVKQ